MIFGTIHLVPHVHVIICLKVQIFIKVQVHQSCYVIVTGLLFIIATLAQVGAHPMKMENTSRKSLDVLHLGHHLRWPARAWRRPWRRGGPSEDVRKKMEAQTDSTSFQFRTPGTARTKTDPQVAYGVRFGRSLYGWKDNFKTLPMEPVSSPNSSGVDRNRPNN